MDLERVLLWMLYAGTSCESPDLSSFDLALVRYYRKNLGKVLIADTTKPQLSLVK